MLSIVASIKNRDTVPEFEFEKDLKEKNPSDSNYQDDVSDPDLLDMGQLEIKSSARGLKEDEDKPNIVHLEDDRISVKSVMKKGGKKTSVSSVSSFRVNA